MKQAQLPSIELRYQEGRSDKVYRVALEASGGGYVVNFAYGRRGSTLNTGAKTPQPLPYPEALAVYDKLLTSKIAKGYKPLAAVENAAGTGLRIVTERDQRDTGLRVQLLNPIEEHEAEAYVDANRWCAQEKFDGRRMLLQRTAASDERVAANRDGLSIGFPDALAERLDAVRGPFVLDGECVGEHFHAFDLLEDGARDPRWLPYALRLRLLGERFGGLGGGFHVAETALTRTAKRELVRRIQAGDRKAWSSRT